MARKTKTTNGESTVPNGNMPASVMEYVITDPQDANRAVRFGDLPVKSQVRIVVKAVNELLTDSRALSKEQIDKYTAEGTLESHRAEAREKRWNSLLSGEFSAGGGRGPAMPEATRVYNEVIAERFAAHWNARRKAGGKAKRPDGVEVPMPALSTLKAESVKKMHARWENIVQPGQTEPESVLARAEADRRIAAKGAPVEAVSDLIDVTL